MTSMIPFEERELGWLQTPDGRTVHVMGVDQSALSGEFVDVEVVPGVDDDIYVLFRKDLIDYLMDRARERGVSDDDAAMMVMESAAREARRYYE